MQNYKIMPKNTGNIPHKLMAFSLGLVLSTASAFSVTSLQEYMGRAMAGDSYAQNRLGEIYMKGEEVPKNFIEASQWFLKAAQNGNAYAANHLAILYYTGQGVTRSAVEAFKWFKISAERNCRVGQYNLAIAYEEGQGVAPNLIQAYIWATLANEPSSIEEVPIGIQTKIKNTLARIEDSLTKEELKEALRLIYQKKEEFLIEEEDETLLMVPLTKKESAKILQDLSN